MNQFEKNLGQALGGRGQYDKQKSDNVRKEALKMFDDKLKLYKWVTWGFLAFETVCMAVLAWGFWMIGDVKWLVAVAALFIVSFESTVLMKLWYWQMNTKIGTLKEMKQLELQIAELTQKLDAVAEQRA